MMKKIMVALAFVAVAGFAGFALAQDSTTDGSKIKNNSEQKREEIKNRIEERKQTLAELKVQRQSMKDEVKETRAQVRDGACTRAENRIRTRIARYENNQDRHVKILGNLESKLDQLIARFEAEGLDVEALKEDAGLLSDLVDSVVSNHAEFIQALKESEKLACGESEGDFISEVGKARRVLPEVKTGIEDIRDFYKSTIRPDILELRLLLQDDCESDDCVQQENNDEDA